ncbi:MAG: hypothetical protein AAFQ82_02925 [Myxococcota bacterium]
MLNRTTQPTPEDPAAVIGFSPDVETPSKPTHEPASSPMTVAATHTPSTPRLSQLSPEVANQPVRRFFRSVLSGSPSNTPARPERSASEWPQMQVDDFFERVLRPRVITISPGGAKAASLEPSESASGSGRVTLRDAFADFIWSQ